MMNKLLFSFIIAMLMFGCAEPSISNNKAPSASSWDTHKQPYKDMLIQEALSITKTIREVENDFETQKPRQKISDYGNQQEFLAFLNRDVEFYDESIKRLNHLNLNGLETKAIRDKLIKGLQLSKLTTKKAIELDLSGNKDKSQYDNLANGYQEAEVLIREANKDLVDLSRSLGLKINPKTLNKHQ